MGPNRKFSDSPNTLPRAGGILAASHRQDVILKVAPFGRHHSLVLAPLLAAMCVLLLAVGCGGTTGAQESTSPSTSSLTTYTNPSHGYSLTYDSTLLAPGDEAVHR